MPISYHITVWNRVRRLTAIEQAAHALVAHWDDPHAGADDGRFDAERWEDRRHELEAELRAALAALPTTTAGWVG